MLDIHVSGEPSPHNEKPLLYSAVFEDVLNSQMLSNQPLLCNELYCQDVLTPHKQACIYFAEVPFNLNYNIIAKKLLCKSKSGLCLHAITSFYSIALIQSTI